MNDLRDPSKEEIDSELYKSCLLQLDELSNYIIVVEPKQCFRIKSSFIPKLIDMSVLLTQPVYRI